MPPLNVRIPVTQVLSWCHLVGLFVCSGAGMKVSCVVDVAGNTQEEFVQAVLTVHTYIHTSMCMGQRVLYKELEAMLTLVCVAMEEGGI